MIDNIHGMAGQYIVHKMKGEIMTRWERRGRKMRERERKREFYTVHTL